MPKRSASTPGQYCTIDAGITPKHPRVAKSDGDDTPPHTPEQTPQHNLTETVIPSFTPLDDDFDDDALREYVPTDTSTSPVKWQSAYKKGHAKVSILVLHM